MHFVCVFGPPAVGKMTVGRELSQITGFRLFHNHMTVDPVLDIFPFGSPPFVTLVSEFRRRIIEEAVAAELSGLIFTYVWGLEDEHDRDLVASYVDIVESAGGTALFVELYAPLEERLVRNETELRLEHKRSKRDLTFSRQNVLDLEAGWVMNTRVDPHPEPVGGVPTATPAEEYLADRHHLRIDNTRRPAADVAQEIADTFGLPRV